tara:strand:- start:2298 stop:8939 length:6642 start_codon:yes stop_codon:yes gene_type:complete
MTTGNSNNKDSAFEERLSRLSREQLALLALDLKGRLDKAAPATAEPIAVVGMGCRFPGANNVDEFWQLLLDETDAIAEVPNDRWDIDEYYSAEPQARGKMLTRCGGFLDNVQRFDHEFFGISKREAISMDPQQRILLEVTWHTLENAGIDPGSLRDSDTGVFVGVCNSDFFIRQSSNDVADLDMYVSTGTAHSVASGRLAYALGLQGPAVSVDTACSSSLVAVHLACQSLRSGESKLVLAGGVNLILLPEITVSLSQANMLSPDGRCKAFDQSANGFVRAEGCGMIALKRLSDAEKDGDDILALISGSATNQDGRSHGLTAPNGPAQEDVIKRALKTAGLHPDQIGLIEAHGTGTSLGDPIEARALDNVFGNRAADNAGLAVGSVKTNIGHAESAAGIAGLIKLVLSVKHAFIPASLHFNKLNAHIEWQDRPLSVAKDAQEWTAPVSDRHGGVSSFGFSGSNAHIVVSSYGQPAKATENRADFPQLLTLSAQDDAALRNLCLVYADHFERIDDAGVAESCRQSALLRTHLNQRIAILATSKEQLLGDLKLAASGDDADGLVTGATIRNQSGQLAFLFPGQGSQYPGMCQSLYAWNAQFRETLDRCGALVREYADIDIVDIMLHDKSARLNETKSTQLAIFCVEYAQARMWLSWGVSPGIVIGHSIGEYVAACIANVFTLEDAIKLVAARADLSAGLTNSGAMAAVFADYSTVSAAVDQAGAALSVAAINSPANVVVSGDKAALEALLEKFEGNGTASRMLNIANAFHSSFVDPILDEYEAIVAATKRSRPTLTVISNVSGDIAKADEITSAAYWRDHLRKPVQFARGVQSLIALRPAICLEVGSHPVLLPMALEASGADQCHWIPTLRRDADDRSSIIKALQALYCAGQRVDWTQVYPDSYQRAHKLPLYPFQGERSWPDERRTGERLAARQSASPTGFNGELFVAPESDRTLLRYRVGPNNPPYLADHIVFEQQILPSPAYIEMIVDSYRQLTHGGMHQGIEISDFAIHDAMRFETPDLEEFVVSLDVTAGHAASPFRVLRNDPNTAGWAGLVSGKISALTDTEFATDLAIADTKKRLGSATPGAELYQKLAAIGLDFGDQFQCLRRSWRSGNEAFAEVALPVSIEGAADRHLIHPALLDSCFHLLGVLSFSDDDAQPYLLIAIDRLRALASLPDRLWVHARLDANAASQTVTANMSLYDDEGRQCAAIDGIHLRRASSEQLRQSESRTNSDLWYGVEWQDFVLPTDSVLRTDLVVENLPGDVSATTGKLLDEYQIAEYEKQIEQLEDIALSFACNALLQLGINFDEFSGTVDDIVSTYRIEVRHRRLVERICSVLCTVGALHKENSVYTPAWTQQALLDCAANRLTERSLPACEPELALLESCGQALAEILTGKTDAVNVLFPGGKFDKVEKLYKDAPYAKVCNEVVRQCVARCTENRKDARAVRILEVGAGTGGTTDGVLAVCDPDSTEYLFTDVSPLFLDRARERYQHLPFVDYAVFDVEKSAAEQGLSPGFDLIVAANVLHATQDLGAVIAGLNDLLAPGGAIVSIEGTRPTLWVDLTFGLTDGWWRFTDTDRRSGHPLMSQDAWAALYSESGLDSVAIIASSMRKPSQEVFVAAKAATTSDAAIEGECWAVSGAGGALQKSLLADLKMRGVTVVQAGTDTASIPAEADRVVHIVAPDGAAPDCDPTADRLLDVAQLLRQKATQNPAIPFSIVTQGALQLTNAAPGDPSQAAVWGLGRVASLEMPEQGCYLIDTDPDSSAVTAAKRAIEAISRAGEEEQIADRAGVFRVPRLSRSVAPDCTYEFDFDGEYSVLITGGLGGLGLHVAEWAADNGAQDISLLTRRTLPPREQWNMADSGLADLHSRLTEIENTGCTLRIVTADVADAERMAQVFAECRGRERPVRSVFHCAVDMSACPIVELDSQTIDSMLSAKVAGTRVLHELCGEVDVRDFVMFSSSTALLGVAGLGHYAAANQYMDSLVEMRRSSGLPGLSINWGTWSEMRIADDADRASFEGAGLNTIPVATGLDCLSRAMAAGIGRCLIANIDWDTLKAVYEARRERPLLAMLGSSTVQEPVRDSTNTEPSNDGVSRLATLSADDRARAVTDIVVKIVTSVLGNTGVIAADKGFFDMGLDSLMAVELKTKLEKRFGMSLPTTLTFNYPTIESLSEFMLGELFDGVDDDAVAPHDTADDDDIEARLSRKLKNLGMT